MEKPRKFCNPCHCLVSRPVYFYSEKISTEENVNNKRKKAKSRPSSANSVKSSRSNKKCNLKESKNSSSDSKMLQKRVQFTSGLKKVKNMKENDKSKITDELKNDLKTIKEQLFLLTGKTKNNSNTNCKAMALKFEMQEKQINELKKKNEELKRKVDQEEAVKKKLQLDEYETKLNSLYKEFVDASKIMDENREKMCQCLKEKSEEYQSMMNSSKQISQMIEQNGFKCSEFMDKFQKTKQNEMRICEENKKLIEEINKLKCQLCKLMNETKCFNFHLNEKENKIKDLNEKLQQLKKCKRMSKNHALEYHYHQLLHKNKCLCEKLNYYKTNDKKRLEKLQMIENNEKHLVTEIIKLNSLTERLSNINKMHGATIAQLNSSVNEKDTIIRCQKDELASRNKQIEILTKNEGLLKNKILDLQEEIVSLRITLNKNYDCAEDCSIHLTEELQALISALYEEIDKTSIKDQQIQLQNEKICQMQCALSKKEKELICVRNELKILREQFCRNSLNKQKHQEQCTCKY